MASSSSSKNDARVRNLPLSSSMRSLLGAVLSLIDRRILSIGEARLWADEEDRAMGKYRSTVTICRPFHAHIPLSLVPSTCETCFGTGFVLVDAVPEGNAEPAGMPAGGSMDPVPGYPPSPPLADTSEMMAFFGSTAAPQALPASSGALNPVDSSSSGERLSSASSLFVRSTFCPVSPFDAGPSTASNMASSSAATGPTQNAATSSAVPPPATSSTGGLSLPLPSVVIPGFQSLGDDFPVPHPTEAVFCRESDGPPFYFVTRGKRVGCFGGWDMVSPYVVKAQGVAFGKKTSLIAAYEPTPRPTSAAP
ncbi:hypothetical protein NMY22_g17559 [Coprinellus aureogranulatus]|nr:hypothetical protein NMY22_g17559 [Coprinellus aureogranulatus]